MPFTEIIETLEIRCVLNSSMVFWCAAGRAETPCASRRTYVGKVDYNKNGRALIAPRTAFRRSHASQIVQRSAESLFDIRRQFDFSSSPDLNMGNIRLLCFRCALVMPARSIPHRVRNQSDECRRGR